MFLFFALALTSVFASIENCGSTGLFTITELKQDPDTTIQPGQNVTLTLLYINGEVVTGGTVETAVTYNFIPYRPTRDDLCTSIVCPLDVGQHDGSVTYPFPSDIIGTIITQIKWFDTNDNLLLCIKSTLKTANKPYKSLYPL